MNSQTLKQWYTTFYSTSYSHHNNPCTILALVGLTLISISSEPVKTESWYIVMEWTAFSCLCSARMGNIFSKFHTWRERERESERENNTKTVSRFVDVLG